jgi:cytochrome P460
MIKRSRLCEGGLSGGRLTTSIKENANARRGLLDGALFCLIDTPGGLIMAARLTQGLVFVGFVAWISVTPLPAWEPGGEDPTAPAADRVGFPRDYAKRFHFLRRAERAEKKQIVTVYGNDLAASVKAAGDLPYPYGSVIVMETADMLKDEQGNARRDGQGHFLKGEVAGLHVMRREKGFGEAYGKNRSGEWEFTEYRADGSYITTPAKSFACAECHIKAGADRDFVYRGRFPEKETK